MQEAIKSLKQIGGERINRETHIALSKILALLECDYGKFDRTTATGFIRILEREYGVDLSGWLKEFNDFHRLTAVDVEDGLMPLEEKKRYPVGYGEEKLPLSGVFDSLRVDQRELLYRILFGAVAVIVVLVGIYLAWPKEESQPYEEAKNLPREESRSDSVLAPSQSAELPLNVVDANAALVMAPGEILEANVSSASRVHTDSNTTTTPPVEEVPVVAKSVVVERRVTPEASTRQTAAGAQEVTINPQERMWLGVIYLDTQQRWSGFVEDPYKLDLSRPQLILAGHGMLDISMDGKVTITSRVVTPRRYHYTPYIGLKPITMNEFIELNGGRGW